MDAAPRRAPAARAALGAVPAAQHLGPISPELALVDPVLARAGAEAAARRRRAAYAHRCPCTRAAEPPAPPAIAAPGGAWPRTVALRDASSSPSARPREAFLGNRGHRARQPASRGSQRRTRRRVRARWHARSAAAAEATVSTTKAAHEAAGRGSAAVTAAPRRRHAQVAWAANVLGVDGEGRPVRRHARLAARPPTPATWSCCEALGESSTASSSSAAGRRASAIRLSAPCTGYRYTIVNYDRRGHRSTGVPTSVVTRCA